MDAVPRSFTRPIARDIICIIYWFQFGLIFVWAQLWGLSKSLFKRAIHREIKSVLIRVLSGSFAIGFIVLISGETRESCENVPAAGLL